MRTAYINKESKVVYIAAFAEDKIQADKKGRLLFGGTVYHPETRTASHTLDSGEEVFEVNGEGLGVGDIYKPTDGRSAGAGMDADATASPEQKTLREAITSKKVGLDAVRKQVLNAQADEDEGLLADLRPQRDRLKKELEVLEAEAKNAG